MEILERVKSLLPAKIDKIELEGSEIVVYTKDKEFFQSYDPFVREAVDQIKKRIEVRADLSITMDQEYTKQRIKELVPEEANIRNIYFEPERSIVVIVAEKPGLVIGKGGETLRQIKKETFWTPRVERIPSIRSDVVEAIRRMMHSEVKFRKDFLNRVGENIFSERKASRDWIRLVFLGGCREVGRSCMLVETPKSKVLVDCGIKAGANNSETFPIFNTKEFDYAELDAIVVSHAHLDHIGAIPILYERGFDGPLYLTTPTLDLATLLWLDYIDVMQRSTTNPLFTAKGVKEAVKHAITLDYGEVSDIAPDVRLALYNAGHILGSAIVHLHIGEGLHNIVYALDQKFGKTNLLDQAFTDFQRVETLIIESTYGSPEDVFPPRPEVEKQLMDVVNKTMERGGICLVPSFSVERAQELMTILVENGFQYPVYLDGMIWDANGIFTAYPEYFGKSMQRKIFAGENPFLSPIFKRIASKEEREKAWEDKPCMIISTSGMLNGGPILEHLGALAEDPKNTLIFIGYQCVRGDTEISLDIGSVEIRKLFKSGEKLIGGNIELRSIDNTLLSLNPNLRKLQNGFSNICSRRFYEGEILRIETEDGNEIFLSPDHPVLTKNYTWKLAKDLTLNDEVWVVKHE
jgi:KH/beta-lactamase-domain protein